jgi:hypothetical protein
LEDYYSVNHSNFSRRKVLTIPESCLRMDIELGRANASHLGNRRKARSLLLLRDRSRPLEKILLLKE